MCQAVGCGVQAIACLILFTFANVLATLLAKMMASHFHKATHFHKMQEAIRKVASRPQTFQFLPPQTFRVQHATEKGLRPSAVLRSVPDCDPVVETITMERMNHSGPA